MRKEKIGVCCEKRKRYILNDGFILYIRKRYPDCEKLNKILGRKIWKEIQKQDRDSKIVEKDRPCYWGKTGAFISEHSELPKTAAQFSFDIDILPELYEFLNELGEQEQE